MPANPNHKKYSRLTSGLALLLVALVGVGCYFAYEFIQQNPSDNVFRDVGIYAGMAAAILFALTLSICACTYNNKTIIQAFSCLSFFFFVVFLVIGIVAIATLDLSQEGLLYAILCILISSKFITYFIVCTKLISSLKLSFWEVLTRLSVSRKKKCLYPRMVGVRRKSLKPCKLKDGWLLQ